MELTLLKFIPSQTADPISYSEQEVVSLSEADGVRFICPQCADGHAVQVWFRERGLPDICFLGWEGPGPKGWAPSGTCAADLTLSPSVWLKKTCGWHGWVKNGVAA